MNNDWLDYLSNGNSLEHHGILGQKWGERNGPPYPLDASDYSAKERKEMTKTAYKQAKKDARATYKSSRKTIRKEAPVLLTNSSKVGNYSKVAKETSKKNLNAGLNVIDKKAQYKATKRGDSVKAEQKSYARSMLRNGGMPGSVADVDYGNNSTKIYEHIANTKGQKYADEVIDRAGKMVTTELAAGLILLGTSMAIEILENK